MFRKLTMSELGRCSAEEYRQQPKWPLVVLLENVRSLQNVGAIFRTADAFAVEGLALCGFTGIPPHRELHRAALGAELSVPWEHYQQPQDAVNAYMARGYTIVALEQCKGSTRLEQYQHDPTQKTLLILGNEVDGVSETLLAHCTLCLEIPQHGTKHSLNVATAAGIALWAMVGVKNQQY